MNSNFDYLRERLHAQAGILPPMKTLPAISTLQVTQWSPQFEQLMRNRLVMGGLRYGILGSPRKPTYNSIASIKQRLALYEKTGNTEHLVDVANLCLVEFVEGKHPNKHFAASDDGPHCTTA